MAWGAVVGQSVLYGLLLSVLFTVVLVGGQLTARDFLAHDYPPAIRDRYGHKSRRGQRVAVVASVLFAAILLGVLTAGLLTVRARTGQPLSFGTAFVVAEVSLMTANVFDLVVLDWLIVVTLRPRFVVLPGTEDMPEYRDWRFHAAGFAKGTVMLSALALLTAAAAVVVEVLA
jgi:hypothetical protein